MEHLVLALVLSLGIGASLGLLGGGGSILTLPILVYVLGLEPKSAIATSLLVVGATSAAAVLPHARAGRVDARMGAAFAVASMAGAYGGARLARYVPSTLLLGGFAVIMLVTGFAMLRARHTTDARGAPRRWLRVTASGIVIGALTGLVGAGGGFVIVPALVLLCGLAMPTAIGTSLVVIAANSFAGFAGYVGHVSFDARIAALVTAAAVAGSFGGALLAGRTKPEALRRVFAWFVLAMAAVMIGKQSSWWLGALVAVLSVGASVVGPHAHGWWLRLGRTGGSTRVASATADDATQAKRAANGLVIAGVGIGLLGGVTAAIGSAICPVCVVAAPTLVGVGALRRWRAGQRERKRRELARQAG